MEQTISGSICDGALNAILSHAAEAHPRECCGLLLGDQGQITHAQPTPNVHPDPKRQFEIDPAALIAAYKAERAGGPCIVGFYHSHPNGRAEPSPTDRERAAHDGKVWAIVANGEVRLFRDGPERFEALSYALDPR
ncbi:M67 family metallopeptidase [Alteriqipengyuania sp. 357]